MRPRLPFLLTVSMLVIAITRVATASAQVAIGQWRSHNATSQVLQVTTGEHTVYAMTQKGLFACDMDSREIKPLTKTEGLSDVGMSQIACDRASSTLAIAYTNGNIDLVQGERVYNLSDIKRNQVLNNKQINALKFEQSEHYGTAVLYVCTAFGIVVIDLERHEIIDTYYLGEDDYVAVNDLAITPTSLVAATPTGLRIAPKNSSRIHIASTWVPDSSNLSGRNITHVAYTSSTSTIFAVAPAGTEAVLYRRPATSDALFDSIGAGSIQSLKAMQRPSGDPDCLLVGERARASVYVDRPTGLNPLCSLADMDWMAMDLNDFTMDLNGTLWVAHNWAGLVCYDPSRQTLNGYHPSSPDQDNAYGIVTANHQTLVCHGGKNNVFASLYNRASISNLVGNRWQALETSFALDTLNDIVDVAVNPRDSNDWWASSWSNGIIHLKGRALAEVYNETNTQGAIRAYTAGDYRTVRIGAARFDTDGNLWAVNSRQEYGLVERRNDGTWLSFNTAAMTGGKEIDHLVVDSVRGYKWFFGQDNRIYVHDGTNRMAVVNPNNGSRLQTSSVNCMVQDHNGDMWIGTNKGIKRIYDSYKMFANGGNGETAPVTCVNLLFRDGGIVEYLMAYENITCMAVDGANRKWVGTATGGLYLLSASGLEQLEHFTESNSPLFSNKIVSIAVQPVSGEVFIGTNHGLQSYRSTATHATAAPSEQIHAYPNPVRPNYNGPIAIKGFTRNAIVHITDSRGHTVHSAEATGGQVVWNGYTDDGRKVESGVYFVFASDTNGNMRSVAKIMIVR